MTDTAPPRPTLRERWHRLRTSPRFPFLLFFGLLVAGGLSQVYGYWWGVRVEQMLARHRGHAERIDVFPMWVKTAVGYKWLRPLEPIHTIHLTSKLAIEKGVSASDLRMLRGTMFLRELRVDGRLSPEACQQLGCLTQLRTLIVYDQRNSEIDADAIDAVMKLPRLTSLSLQVSESIEPVVFQKLATMNQLQRLRIEISRFNRGESKLAIRLRDLAKSQSLVTLEFVGCNHEDLRALTSLLPDGSPPLPQLRELRLGFSARLTDRSLANLRNLPSLIHLDVSYSQIPNEGLTQLKGLPYLRTLYLEGCKGITNDGTAVLASMPNLQSLNVKQTNITNEGLLRLATLPRLRCLRAYPGGPEARAELRKQLPAGCKLDTN